VTSPSEVVEWHPQGVWRRVDGEWQLLTPTGAGDEFRLVGGDFTTRDVAMADIVRGEDDLPGERARPHGTDGRLIDGGHETPRTFYVRRRYRGTRAQVERVCDALLAATAQHGWDRRCIGTIHAVPDAQQPAAVSRVAQPELGPAGVRTIVLELVERVASLEAEAAALRKGHAELESYTVEKLSELATAGRKGR